MTRKYSKGFTLIEFIVAVGLASISAGVVLAITNLTLSMNQVTSTKRNINEFRTTIISYLSSESVWANIIENADGNHPSFEGVKMNTQLRCVKEHTNCVEGDFPLTLFDIKGHIISDPNDGTLGYTREGQICHTYSDEISNSNRCIYRVNLTWKPVCSGGGSCVDPQVVVNFRISTAGGQISSVTNNLTVPLSIVTIPLAHTAPVVLAKSFMTNSPIYYPSQSEITIDPEEFIYTPHFSAFTISLPSTTSSKGGSVSLSNNKIVYRPPSGSARPDPNSVFGLDTVLVRVTDNITGLVASGKIWIKVMTPYTWLGQGTGESTNALNNFCGKVVNGSCDRRTFPANDRDKNWLFNDVCDSCNVTINSTSADALILAKKFTGVVNLRNNLDLVARSSTWVPQPIFQQNNGSFIGNNYSMTIRGGGLPWTDSPGNRLFAFLLNGGEFIAPSSLSVIGPFKIENPTSFIHSNGVVAFGKVYGSNGMVTAPGVSFYDVKFDSRNLGTLEIAVTDDFTVLHHLYKLSQNVESSITSYSDTSSQAAKIKLLGDIYLTGSGGTYGYSQPAIISLEGSEDQTIHGPAAPPSPVTLYDCTPSPDYYTGVNNKINFLPNVHINKNRGKVTITGYVGFNGLSVIRTPGYLGEQALDVASADIFFGLSSGTSRFVPGPFHYKNVYNMVGPWANFVIDSPELNIDGDLWLFPLMVSSYYGQTDSSGNGISRVNLKGNLFYGGGFAHNYLNKAFTVNMIGDTDAVIQTKTSGVSQAHIVINKSPGHTVTIKDQFLTTRNLTVAAPAIGDPSSLLVDPGVEVKIVHHGSNGVRSIFNTPGVVFQVLTVGHNFVANSDIIVNEKLNLCKNGDCYANASGSGTIRVNRDISIDGDFGGGGSSMFNLILQGPTTSRIYVGTAPEAEKSLLHFNVEIAKSSGASTFFESGKLKLNSFQLNSASTFTMSNRSTSLNLVSGSSIIGSTINKNSGTISTRSSSNFRGTVNP